MLLRKRSDTARYRPKGIRALVAIASALAVGLLGSACAPVTTPGPWGKPSLDAGSEGVSSGAPGPRQFEPRVGVWLAEAELGDQADGGLTRFTLGPMGVTQARLEWPEFEVHLSLSDEPGTIPITDGELFFEDETAGIVYTVAGTFTDDQNAYGTLLRTTFSGLIPELREIVGTEVQRSFWRARFDSSLETDSL